MSYDIEEQRLELQHSLNMAINAWTERMKDAHGLKEWARDRQVSIVLERLLAVIQERRK